MSEQPAKPKMRRSFGFCAAIVLVLGGVLYPLSFGPACWISAHWHARQLQPGGAMVAEARFVTAVYYPVLHLMARHSTASDIAKSFAELLAPRDFFFSTNFGFVDCDGGKFVWITGYVWPPNNWHVRPPLE